MNVVTIRRKVVFEKSGREKVASSVTTADGDPGRVPRLSKLMALAIRYEQLIDAGEIKDLAEIARLGHVTRARLSQIMNLRLLAPDIQEEILFLPRVVKSATPITEREVRHVTLETDWRKQRRMWALLKRSH